MQIHPVWWHISQFPSSTVEEVLPSLFAHFYPIIQSLSHIQLCNPMKCRCQASLSFTISLSLLKLMSIE